MKNQPFLDCPRFESCSINNCPLHKKYPNLSTFTSDPEQKCKAQKPTRIKIAERYPGILKFNGLNIKEYRLKLKRESRTPEEWEKLRLGAKKMLQSRGFNIRNKKEDKLYHNRFNDPEKIGKDIAGIVKEMFEESEKADEINGT
jgi:hypothetical protein